MAEWRHVYAHATEKARSKGGVDRGTVATTSRLGVALFSLVSLFLLPASALAQVQIPDSTTTVVLQDLSPGSTTFNVASAVVITTSAGGAIQADSTQDWVLTNAGSVTGATFGIELGALTATGASFDNTGTVVANGATDAGITFTSAGTFVNHGTGSVTANGAGVVLAAGGSASNDGVINTGAGGVTFQNGGTFTQSATGSILTNGAVTTSSGVVASGGTVGGTNAGTIDVAQFGVLYNGAATGTFSNSAGGQITGAQSGVRVTGTARLDLVNAGTITGNATGGVDFATAGNTVSNTGVISGGSAAAVAINLEAGSTGNVITLGTGSNIIGTLVSASATNQLLLTGSATEDSPISGFGVVMNGTAWTLSGAIQTSSAVTVNSGTLTLTGANTYTGATTINGGTLQVGNGGTTGSIPGDVTDDGTLTFNRSDTVTFGGLISGTGAVVQSGTGTTVLTAQNTYTGGTTINSGGTLQVGNNSFIGAIVGDVVDNGTLVLARTNIVTYSGVISGTGAVVKNAVGTLILTGASTYSGTTTINAGVLQVGNGGTTGTLGTGAVTDNATLTFNRTDAVTVANAISGSGALIQAGTGTTILTGANSYGATTISAGTLQVGNGGASGSLGTGAVSNSGILTFNKSVALPVTNAISGAGTIVQAGSGTTTLSGTVSTGGISVTGGSLFLNGSTTVPTIATASGTTLGGSGTVSGSATIVSGATLSPGAAGVAGTFTVGGLTLSSGSLLALNLGTPNVVGGTSDLIQVNGNLTVAGTTLNVTDAGGFGPGSYRLINYTGTLTGSAASFTVGTLPGAPPNTAVVQTGVTGQVNLIVSNGLATNFWDGPNTTANGVVNGGTGTWNTSTTNWTNVNGSFNQSYIPGIAFFQGVAGTVTLGTAVSARELQFSTDGYVVSGAQTLTLLSQSGVLPGLILVDAGMTARIDSTVAGTVGLEKGNPGTLILTGTDTYTGGTTITAGTLQLGNGGATGSIVGDVIDNGALVFNRTAALTFAGAISGTGSLTDAGTGAISLSGASTYTGGTTVNAGATLSLGAGGATGSIVGNVLDNGTLSFNRSNAYTFAGVISGTGAVTKLAGGTTTLTGTNTYTGTTTITTGTLNIGGSTASGTLGTGAVIDNATLQLARTDNVTIANNISGTGALSKTETSTATLTGANTYSGTTTITAGTLQIGAGGTAGTIGTGATSISSGATLAFNRSDAVTYAGIISGAGSLTQIGAGTTTLSGANTYTGTTLISAGGLTIGSGGTTGALGTGAVTNNTTLTFNRSNALTVSSLISGAGTIVQAGAGATSLTGATVTANAINVTGGSLFLNSATSTTVPTITTANGTTLGGTSNVSGSATIANGATLSPGPSAGAVGTFTLGGLTLNTGSTLLYDLSQPNVVGGTANDLIVVNGNITVTGTTINVNDIGNFATTPGVYRLFNYTGTLTGAAAITIGTTPGYTGSERSIQTTVPNQVNLIVATAGLPIQFWDGPGPASNGVINGGNGTWNLATANWTDSGGALNAGWASGVAIFSGATGTVTLGTNINVRGMQFSTNGYTINPGGFTLTLSGIGAAASVIRTDAGVTATISAPLAGTLGMRKDDTGTLVLTGTNTYTGGTTIVAGTLQVGGGGTTGSILGDVVDNAALVFNRSDNFTFPGVISGTGTLTKRATDTETLTGANTYSGGTTISAGTLQIGLGAGGGTTGTFGTGPTTISSGAALALNRSDTAFVYGGVISGAGVVNQIGNGTATLTGANTYTGATTIAAGTLQIGNGGATGTLGTGSTSVASGAALTFNRTGALAYAGVISGAGVVNQIGSGTTTLTGANTYSGTTTISAGVLQIGSGATGTLGTGNTSISSGAALTFNRTGTLAYGGAISGAGAVNQIGSGTTTLTGANTYTGTTTISAGVLQIGAGGTIGTLGTGTVSNSGTLTFNRTNPLTVANTITGAGTIIQAGTGTTTLTGTVAAGTINVTGGSLFVNGATTATTVSTASGTTLGGSGSITGTATISSGATLAPGASAGAAGTLTLGGLVLNTGSTLAFDLGAPNNSASALNDRLQVNGNLTVTGTTVNVTDTGAFATTPGSYRLIDYTGTLTGSAGNFTLGSLPGVPPNLAAVQTAVTGQVNLIVANGLFANFWDGSNTTANGIVDGGTGTWNNSTPNWTNVNATFNQAYLSGLAIFSGTAGTVTLGENVSASVLQFTTTGYVITGAPTLTMLQQPGPPAAAPVIRTDAAVTATIASTIAGTAGLEKTGVGTLVLSGTNTYTGGTTITAGTLQIGAGGTTGSIGTNAIVDNGTLTFNRSDSLFIGGAISGSGAVVQAGTGTTALTGTNTYTGGTTINAGTLQLGNGAGGSIVGDVVDNGTFAFARSGTQTFAGVISGSGTVRQVNANTTVLTATNTYTGGTTISAGTLQVGDSPASTATLGSGNILDNGTLVFNRASAVVSAVVSGTGALQQIASGTVLSLTGANTYTGGTTIAAGATVDLGNGGATGSIAGNVVDNGTLVFDRSNSYVFGGAISGTGAVQKLLATTTTLTGTNTYTGPTSVLAGTLQIGNAGPTGTLGAGAVSLSAGTTLTFSRTNALTVANTITGTGTILQVGSGATTLSGTVAANVINVNAGSLFVNGTATVPTVTTTSGTTLGGTGTIVGSTTIAAGATLSPGIGGAGAGAGGTGTLTLGNLTLQAGSTLAFDFGQANIPGGASNDLLVVNGNINLIGTTLNVTDSGAFATTPGVYRLINYTGTITGTADLVTIGTTPGYGPGEAILQTNVPGRISLIVSAGALVQFWDGTGAEDDHNIAGGTGTWNTTVANWTDSVGAANAGWAGDLGVFSGAAGTVTLGEDITFKSLQFATTGYVVNGGGHVLTPVGLGGTNFAEIDVDPGSVATIDAPIVGTAALRKGDTGTLVLTGANTYSGGTLITTGTLQLGNGGTTGSIVGDVTDNAAIVFNRFDDITFPYVISGIGTLRKEAADTVTLTGNNTYSGTTTINGGILQIGAGGTSGTLGAPGNVIIASGANLAFNRSDTMTVVNSISGAGTVTQLQTGTTILTGNNTWTGVTTVTAGTLQMGNGGTTGNIGTGDVSVAAGTSLVANRSNTLLLPNNISGAGSVRQIGAGTTIYTGTGTYTGGTTITTGTLQIGNASNAGSIVSDVSDSSTLAFSRSDVYTYGGVISGSGTVLQLGPGTTAFTGSNTYTGTTTVQAGNLQIGAGGATGTLGSGNVVIATGGAQLVFDRNNAMTVGNVLSGGGAVRQIGAGTTTLTATDTYSGTTFISNGQLRLGAGGASGSIVTDVQVFTPGSFAFNRGDAYTFGKIISGTGQVLQLGAGTTILTGTNTYTGATTISAGTLQLGASGATGAIGTGPVGIASGAALSFSHNNPFTFANTVTGTGTINQIGSGATTLSGTAAAAATNVSTGTLLVTGTLTSPVTVAAGATLGGTGTIAGAVEITSGGKLAPGLSPGTLTMTTLTLDAGSILNFELGAPNVVGGALNDLLQVNGNLTVAGATLNVADTGSFASTAGSYRLINYTGTLTGDETDFTLGTLAGVPPNTSVVQTAVSGQVNLIVSNGLATNFWDGPNVIDNGAVDGGTGTWDNTTANWTNAGGTFNQHYVPGIAFFQGAAGTVTLGENVSANVIQFSTGGYVVTGAPTLTLLSQSGVLPGLIRTDAGVTATIAAPIAGTVGLEKGDPGTLILTGTNTYTGGTTITAGTLQLGNGGTSGTILGNVTDSGTLTFDRSDAYTFAGAISGGGSVQQIGTGTTILTGANTYTGGTTITAGTLQVGNGGATGTLAGNVADNSALVFDRSDTLTFAGNVSGTGSLTQQGAGTLVLTGASTYSGPTAVDAGTLIVRGSVGTTASLTVADTGNAALTVDSGGDLHSAFAVIGVTGGSQASVLVTGSGSTLLNDGFLTLLSGTSTLTVEQGGLVHSGSLTFAENAGAQATVAVTGAGTSMISDTTLEVARSGVASLDVSGGAVVTSGQGFIGRLAGGEGTVLVTGAGSSWTNTGPDLTIGNHGTGTLTIANGATVSAPATYVGFFAEGTGTINIGAAPGDPAAAPGTLTTPTVALGVGSATVNFNHTASSYTFAPSITGAGTVNAWAGTTALTGASTYTGATNVNGGTLLVNGSLGNTTTTVSSGATLGGAGAIAGTATVASGGALAPGASAGVAGTLTLGGLTLSTGSILNFDLGAPNVVGGALNDLLQVNGNLTVAGTTLNVTDTGAFASTPGSYRLINYTGTLTGSASDFLLGTLAGVPPNTTVVQTGVTGQVNLIVSNGLATNFWDGPNATSNGAVDGGTGTWNTTTTNWTNVNGTFNQSYIPGIAFFQGAAGTVTLGEAVSANVIQFSTDGYIVMGAPTLTLLSQSGALPGLIRTDPGVTATIAAPIAGTVGLEKGDAGTLILTGTNTYTGGTTITAGTLQLGNGGAAGSIAGNVADSGTLAFNRSDASTFAGVISGTGAVTQLGTGTTTLTGANTYSGLTTITAGTLNVGGGGATGSLGTGAVVDNANLTLARSNTVSIANAISGTGTLTKLAAGTAILTGSNTYTGPTTISAGTLQLGSGGTTGSIVGDVLNNATLAFDRSNPYVFAGVISGTGSVTQLGTGTTTLTAANTYSGGTTITAGTLQIGNGGTTGSIVGNVTDNATLAFNRSDALTFGGVISGTGAVTKLGTGTTTLTAASTYTGPTTVTAGTLLVNGSLTSPTTVAAAATLGGTGTIAGAAIVNGTLAPGAAGAGTLTMSALTLNTGSKLAFDLGAPNVVGGPLNDLVQVNGNVTVTGTTLNVTDTGAFSSSAGSYRLINYTGTLTGSAANFTLGALPGLPPNTAVVQTAVTGQVNLIVSNGLATNFWDGTNTTANGAVDGGTGTWNTTTPNWTNASGTFNQSYIAGLAIFEGAAGTVTLGTSVSANVIQFLTNGYVVSGAQTLTLLSQSGVLPGLIRTDAGVTATIAAPIGGTVGLEKADPGTLILTGTNTYTGGTTISGGTLQIGNGGTTGTVGGGNILNNGTLVVDRSNAVTYAGVVSGTGNVVQLGTGTVTVTGANTYTGGTTISAGTLQIGSGGTTGSIVGNVTDNGTLAFNRSNAYTFAGIVSGTGALTQAGTGTTILTGANTYTGTTTISAGTLQIGAGGAAGALGTGPVVDNGALVFNKSTATLVGVAISGTGSLVQSGTGVTTLAANNTYTGGTTINSGTLQVGNGGTTGSVGGGNVLNNATLAVNRSNAVTYAGVVSGTGNVVLLGTGTVTVTGANTYTGGTTISAGTLQIGNGGATGSIVGNVTDNSTLAFNRSNAYTFAGAISGTGGLTQAGAGTTTLTAANSYSGPTTISAGTLQIGAGGATGSLGTGAVANSGTLRFNKNVALTVANTISGSGAIVQAGPGTTTLTGATVAAGSLVVTGGSLFVNSAATTVPTITTASGTTLGGSGTVSGATTIASGATLSPGASAGAVGTLTLGDLTLNTGSILSFDLGAPNALGGPLNDRLQVNGDLVVTGTTLNVTDTGTFATTPGAYRLIDYTGSLTGSFLNFTLGTLPGVPPNSVIVQTGVAGQVNLITINANVNPLATNFWDGPNTTANNAVDGGTGTWNNTTGNWTDAGGALNRGYVPGVAFFQGAAGTVTLGEDVSANIIQFSTDGYLVTGAATLTLLSPSVLAPGLIRVDAGVTATIAAPIAGTVGVEKSDPGTLILTGTNTYSGGTKISGGILQIGNGSTTGILGGGPVIDNGTLVFNRSDALTVANFISGSGALTQAGSGTTTLTSNNTYSGPTTIAAGTLQVGDGGTTGAIGAGAVTDNGTLAFNRSDDITVGNAITGTGTLVQAGTGTLTLSSAATLGATAVNAGTLLVTSTLASPVTVASTATLGGTGTIAGAVTVSGTISPGVGGAGELKTGDLTLGAGSILAMDLGDSGVIGGAFNDLLTVTGNLTLAGTTLNITDTSSFAAVPGVYRLINYTGSLTGGDSDIILGVTPGFTPPNIVVQTSVANEVNLVTIIGGFPVSFWDGGGTPDDGVIAGGTGTWNNVLGNWTDPAGVPNSGWLPGLAVFGAAAGTVTVGSAVEAKGIQFSTGGYVIGGAGQTLTMVAAPYGGSPIRVDAGLTDAIAADLAGTSRVDKFDAGTLVLTGTNTYSGGTRIVGGTLQLGDGGTTGSIVGDVVNEGVLAFDRSDALTFAGAISGTGSVEQFGAGTTTLTGANTYTGQTTIAAGALQIGAGGALGTLGTGAVLNSGMLIFNRSDALVVPNAISGVGTIVQAGAGKTALSGVSAAGAALVADGTLAVDGTLTTPTLTVFSGATLGGKGAVVGTVIVQNGGTLAPGDSPGTLTVGTLNLAPNAILDYELDTPGVVGGVNDLVIVTGNLTLDGTLNVIGLPGFGVGGYRLINYGGSLLDRTLVFGLLPDGFAYKLDTSHPGQVNLDVLPLKPPDVQYLGWHAAGGQRQHRGRQRHLDRGRLELDRRGRRDQPGVGRQDGRLHRPGGHRRRGRADRVHQPAVRVEWLRDRGWRRRRAFHQRAWRAGDRGVWLRAHRGAGRRLWRARRERRRHADPVRHQHLHRRNDRRPRLHAGTGDGRHHR